MRELFMTTDNFGLGETGMSMDEQFRTVAELGFNGIEHHFPATRKMADCLRHYGLKMIHSEFPFNAPDRTGARDDIDVLQELGVQYVAGYSRARTHEEALRTAEELNTIGKQAYAYGFKVFFHNTAAEFIFDRGEYLIETLLKNTDPLYVCSQLDLGWVVCAGADPVPLLKKYPGRFELMHVKPCTKIYGMKAVWPAGQPTLEASEEYARLFHDMQGPFSQLVRDYEEPMKVAERLGCRCFIYEREEYYQSDRLAVMQDDIAGLRRFW